MALELAIRFAALYVSAKLMALRLPFYSAAFLAVAWLYVIEGLQHDKLFGPVISSGNLIRLGVTLLLFYFLDRNEGHRIRWLLTLALTFAVLTFVVH